MFFFGFHPPWLTLLLFGAHSNIKYLLCLGAFFSLFAPQSSFCTLVILVFVILNPFYNCSCCRPLRCTSHLYCVRPFVSHWKNAAFSCWSWQVNFSFKKRKSKQKNTWSIYARQSLTAQLSVRLPAVPGSADVIIRISQHRAGVAAGDRGRGEHLMPLWFSITWRNTPAPGTWQMCVNTEAVEQRNCRKVCDSDDDQEDSGLETHTEGWKHLAG